MCWALQAREIVRRCLCGYSPALALQTSNPIKIPPGRGEKPAGGRSVQITSDHLRNLKHDVEFIKRAHDLRDVGEGKTGGKGKGNAKLAPPRCVNASHLCTLCTSFTIAQACTLNDSTVDPMTLLPVNTVIFYRWHVALVTLHLINTMCSTQERRAARRELKTLAKAEAVSEEAQAKKLAEMEMREQEEMLNSQLADTSQVAT